MTTTENTVDKTLIEKARTLGKELRLMLEFLYGSQRYFLIKLFEEAEMYYMDDEEIES